MSPLPPLQSPVDRSPLTGLVLDALRTTGKQVGDGVLPQAGWLGQPQTPGVVFDPFLVASEIIANVSYGGIGDPQSDWLMPYLVESFGVTRAQCSAMQTAALRALPSLRGKTYLDGAVARTVHYLRFDNLGAPGRVDSINPPFWHAQSGFTVYLQKG